MAQLGYSQNWSSKTLTGVRKVLISDLCVTDNIVTPLINASTANIDILNCNNLELENIKTDNISATSLSTSNACITSISCASVYTTNLSCESVSTANISFDEINGISSLEFGYISGLTGNVQGQLAGGWD